MTVNWGILANTPDAGVAFSQGAEQGGERARQYQTNNALAAYAQNPDDQNAARSLLAVDPRLGMSLMNDQRERKAHSDLQQIRQRAASGDHDAITELFARDPESWTRLDAPHREQIKQATSFHGQCGLGDQPLARAATSAGVGALRPARRSIRHGYSDAL
jgi:hypothetical protein